jgi:hypothetical protein
VFWLAAMGGIPITDAWHQEPLETCLSGHLKIDRATSRVIND